MTPKQRWLALLSGRKPDRLPCDYWATAEVTARLRRDLNCATDRELWRRLGVDKCIYLAPVHPAAQERTWHIQSLFSLWRVSTRKVSYGDNIGVYEEDAAHPLAGAECVADVENFPWPDPDEFDTSALRQAAAEWPDYPVLGATSEPFYLYCRLRGMEQALADLIEHPDLAGAILNRIFAFDHALIRRVLLEAGDVVDLVYLAEDLGTQDSLLISPALFRRYLKPRLARLVNLVHSHGKYVFHHDDGAIRPLVPDLLETGIDILNPIQWRCRGMNRAQLAAEFGARVVFHGAIDNQQTLPFGSPADVRREVAESIQLLSAGRGYIVAPCHNIQPNTPTENIVALYQAVGDFGS